MAKTIGELGVVTVQNLTFSNEVTAEGLWPNLTVYFHYGQLEKRCTCGRCSEGTS